MNSLIQCFGVLFVVYGFGLCDRAADVQCVKDGMKALEGKTDEQLFNLTQTNLNIGAQMVIKRAVSANATGLTCYLKFYNVYSKGMSDLLVGDGETKRLNTARNSKERSSAVKAIAGITQTIRCDEDWRAKNVDKTNSNAQCTQTEQKSVLLNRAKFDLNLRVIKGGMSFGSFVSKFNNKIMSTLIADLKKLYSGLYANGKKCSQSLSTAALRCSNLKMFTMELKRLGYLATLTAQAKISNALPKT